MYLAACKAEVTSLIRQAVVWVEFVHVVKINLERPKSILAMDSSVWAKCENALCGFPH